ncbi:biliverdin-producing heme oxygenase [Mucilaginibacter litoreus]|uniref:Biliverdin-producing heme oxygenase n=1 Tax=Mucilaginibacter litoreus TaxID=1048221 RepID=A0ABW3AXW5_9SPHI
MLSEILKEETRENHQQLEKMLIGKLKAVSGVKDYADLLKYFYGYFGGLEDQINQAIDPDLLPDNADRRKTQSIAEDIKALGETVPAKANSDTLPRIKNHLEALGALYVIEGSTLGGKIISKMMEQQLALNGAGLSFFTGYGDRTGQMWETFKQVLDQQAANPEQEAVVIAAANETFLKFGEWFARNKTVKQN